MIIRSAMRFASSGSVALAAGLLVLLPTPTTAAAQARTDPVVPPAALGPTAAAADSPVFPAAAAGAQLYESGIQVKPGPGTAKLPEVSALSWLVADARTGAVLAARNAHRELPPASTLKTLFAVTALPHLPAGARHKVTEADLAGVGEGSSMVGVVPGQSYRVADLWRGVFLSSGNDAVHVLAAMNGGVDSTVTQMQKKARSLGALDTHVVSPDGYDAPGQVSSAYDLAVFGRTGLASSEFVGYSSTPDAQFPGQGTSTFGIQNTNRLLSGREGVEPYPGMIGVKNGYTSHAGNTLIAAARHGNRTLLVTVMNPQSGVPQAVYEEARSLLDWGFGADQHVTPVGSLQAPPDASPSDVAQAGSGHPANSGESARNGGTAGRSTAADTGTGPWYYLPVFVGAGCLAAFGLFLLGRRVHRRPAEEE
jgi:D-alanyl-D-alanine carboxypeptidase (penicillin-binding protein 5/6)